MYQYQLTTDYSLPKSCIQYRIIDSKTKRQNDDIVVEADEETCANTKNLKSFSTHYSTSTRVHLLLQYHSAEWMSCLTQQAQSYKASVVQYSPSCTVHSQQSCSQARHTLIYTFKTIYFRTIFKKILLLLWLIQGSYVNMHPMNNLQQGLLLYM